MATIDSITLKRLIVVKQIYQQAIVNSLSFSIANKTIALICFDYSIETTLKSIIVFYDTSKTPPDNFPGILNQCEDILHKANLGGIPDKSNINYVHSLRNDAQHKAKYPNDSDINDCRTYTRDFLNRILNQVWGITLEKISLTDYIQHAEVKKFLTDAEISLENGKYVDAVENASAGLTKALALVQNAIVGRTSHFRRAFIMSDSFKTAEPDENVFRAFERMQRVLLYVSLGINYANYMSYLQIAGSTIFTLGGGHSQHGMKQPMERNDAEFVVSYSIDTVIQIENHVGSLDKPFGREYWL